MNNVPPKKMEQKEEIAVNETIVILQQSNNVQFYDVTTPAPNTSNTTTNSNNNNNNNNNLPKTNYGINVMQLKIGNAIAFIITLIFNYISSAGLISPYGIGTISRKYPTKITPSSGAFGIWGYIYTLECCFIIYQFFWPTEDEALLLHGVGFWYISTCIFNSLWIIVFVQGDTVAMFFAVLIIACILASICKIYINTSCWKKERSNILENIVLDVHFSMYAGWVTVATIVNTSIAISTIWNAESEAANTCGVIMLLIALGLNIIIVLRHKDCVWGYVLTWASYWISVKSKGVNEPIYTTAIVVSITIAIISTAVVIYRIVKLFRGRKATEDEIIVQEKTTKSLFETLPPGGGDDDDLDEVKK